MASNLPRPNHAGVPGVDPAALDAEAARLAPRPLTRRAPLAVRLSAEGRSAAALQRTAEDAVIHEARQRALTAIVDAWAQALDAWSVAWLHVQQAGLARRTQAALQAEYERLEAELRAFAERFHADVGRAYDEVAALRQSGAHANLLQSREHDIEMRLHHYHAFVSDVRDRFVSALRAHTS